IPVIGYNFSLAGVWGWRRQRLARGGAMTAVFDLGGIDGESPIPDGMAEIVPVAEEVGVRLAAHPDDPPVERLRGTARLVNSHTKYDRLLALAPSRANAL